MAVADSRLGWAALSVPLFAALIHINRPRDDCVRLHPGCLPIGTA